MYIEAPERPGHLDREERLLTEALSALGLSWTFIPARRLMNRTMTLDPDVPAAGGIRFVRAAFACAGMGIPQDASYPEELRPFLGRRIRQTTLGRALHCPGPIFIKPARRTKRFTGLVTADGAVPPAVMGVPRSEPVWISDPIQIASEWRTYTADRTPLHTSWSGGNRSAPPDASIIMAICRALAADRPYAGGCAIDTAVTTDGRTILLEINDGYSVGAYGDVPAMSYYTMISTRWKVAISAGNRKTLKATSSE